jgi:hypothetical protein
VLQGRQPCELSREEQGSAAAVAALLLAVRGSGHHLSAAAAALPAAACQQLCCCCCAHLQIFRKNLDLAVERNYMAAKYNPDLKGQEDELMAHGITQFSEWHELQRCDKKIF